MTNNEPNPVIEVSILVPTMNEEVTVGAFVDMCIEGFERAGVVGEVVLVDSSSDRTALIAREKGAIIVNCRERGIGRAYQAGIRHVRGKYVIMGDADCTYDFREIRPFLEALRAGYEFVMGTRVKGQVEKGSRPALHRYFGAPLTNFAFNRVLGAQFSDIHCGMRAMTREALIGINLTANGWEYASQMIIKSIRAELKSVEVPINFLKEPEGRQGKLQANRLEPWKAGWRTLHTVFSNRPAFFLLRPGFGVMSLGVLASLLLASGIRRVGSINFSGYSQSSVAFITLLGGAAFGLGVVADSLDSPNRQSANWRNIFTFNRTFVILLMALAFWGALMASFVGWFASESYEYSDAMAGLARTVVLSFTLLGLSFFFFCASLILEYNEQVRPSNND